MRPLGSTHISSSEGHTRDPVFTKTSICPLCWLGLLRTLHHLTFHQQVLENERHLSILLPWATASFSRGTQFKLCFGLVFIHLIKCPPLTREPPVSQCQQLFSKRNSYPKITSEWFHRIGNKVRNALQKLCPLKQICCPIQELNIWSERSGYQALSPIPLHFLLKVIELQNLQVKIILVY